MNGNPLILSGSALALPALFAPTPDAGKRFIEFFTANIRNPNTRKAYARAAGEFAAWCETNGLTELRGSVAKNGKRGALFCFSG